MREENSVSREQPRKKRRSLWWIWLLLILAAFAGGTVLGLKLNTLPLPNEVKDRLYPILESYIPGSTAVHEPAAVAVTPAPTELPVPVATLPPETPAPESTPAPETAPAAAVTEPAPVLEIAEPAKTEAPTAAKAELIEIMQGSAESEKTVMPEAENASAPVRYIGVNAALETALSHAEVTEQEAEITGVVRTKDADGKAVYEVGFTVGEIGYDYTVDAVSGEVDGWQISGMTFSDDVTYGATFTGNTMTEAEAAREAIDEEGAKEIAYAHAKVKPAEVVSVTAELLQDADTEYYHLEFRTATRSFRYDVNTAAGEILSFEKTDR